MNWRERSIYDQRLYQTGRDEVEWSRVADWNVYLAEAVSGIGRSADKKVTVTLQRGIEVDYVGVPYSFEPTEPETRTSSAAKKARAKRIRELAKKHSGGLFQRQLTSNEVLGVILRQRPHEKDVEKAMERKARSVSDFIDISYVRTTMDALEGIGLIEKNANNFWVATPLGHVAAKMGLAD